MGCISLEIHSGFKIKKKKTTTLAKSWQEFAKPQQLEKLLETFEEPKHEWLCPS